MKTVKIGRNPGNDVVLTDLKVSRFHCHITQYDNGSCQVFDVGSSNGTFVNGRRIFGQTGLSPNDVIRVGDTVLPWQNYFSSMEGNATPQVTVASQDQYPHTVLYQEQMGNPPAYVKEKGCGFGVASLVLGIVGVGPLAIVFGAVSLSRHESARGLAIAGLILGIVVTAIYTTLFFIYLSLL